jgi:hypothetical protein
MPASPRRDLSPQQWLERTESARREARYRAAEQRVRKIVAGAPPLTAEQRAKLAAMLVPAGDAA